MKHILFFCFTVLFSTSVWSQIDNRESKSTTIPAIESEQGEETETNSLNIEPLESTDLSTPNENSVNGLSVSKRPDLNTEEEFSMFYKKKFGNPAELYQEKLNRQLEMPESEAANPDATGSLVDVYFGDVKTKSGKVNIVYRDHQAFDGDRIMVLVNDDIIQSNVLLTNGYSGFKLELQPGFNKIDFKAINQGTSGPNTAEFQILDENGNIITGNQWNLATGVKASIIVVKE
ncbi:hypothetical protein [Formosa sp. S-31]|uniref:hypothetical protein n=1 Tax=Formosa sp. S-31 TaxID=2790949 RepID=UPI003EBDB69A